MKTKLVSIFNGINWAVLFISAGFYLYNDTNGNLQESRIFMGMMFLSCAMFSLIWCLSFIHNPED